MEWRTCCDGAEDVWIHKRASCSIFTGTQVPVKDLLLSSLPQCEYWASLAETAHCRSSLLALISCFYNAFRKLLSSVRSAPPWAPSEAAWRRCQPPNWAPSQSEEPSIKQVQCSTEHCHVGMDKALCMFILAIYSNRGSLFPLFHITE